MSVVGWMKPHTAEASGPHLSPMQCNGWIMGVRGLCEAPIRAAPGHVTRLWDT